MTYGIYRYIDSTEQIIYIGIGNILSRISNHKSEEKFQPYINKCKIQYAIMPNYAVASALESLLTDKYRPILNDAKKYTDSVQTDYVKEPEWLPIETLTNASNGAGRPLKNPDKGRKREWCKTINIAVPKETIEQVNQYALLGRGMNLTEYVNTLIEADLDKNIVKYQEIIDQSFDFDD